MHPFHSLLALGSLGSAEILMIGLLVMVAAVVGMLPFWLICKKAGLSPWLSCLIFIPFGALVLPFILAFSDWPTLKRDTTPS
jgi:predicted membrane channel-forming protein YqfA (hemolysin III family)